MILSFSGDIPSVRYCHGSVYSSKTIPVIQYFSFEEVQEKEDIELFVEFMNECGFKCELRFEENDFEIYGLPNGKYHSDFNISYNPKDFISLSHWRVGFTAIRSLYYSIIGDINKEFWTIGLDAAKTWDRKTDAYYHLISSFANLKSKADYNFYVGNHNLISSAMLLKFEPITRKELEENYRNFPTGTVNKVSIKII